MFNVLSIVVTVLSSLVGFTGVVLVLFSRQYAVRYKQPTYQDVLTTKQRKALEQFILRRFSILTCDKVHEVAYTVVCIASRNGIHYVDITSEHGLHTLKLHVEIANRRAVIDIGDGFKASCFKDSEIAERAFCDERYIAAAAPQRHTMEISPNA